MAISKHTYLKFYTKIYKIYYCEHYKVSQLLSRNIHLII
jgi:hypothetical protein